MYKHIVFDIDGTLIDTEKAVLIGLQDTLLEVVNKRVELNDLKFALGIPGEVTLGQLGIKDVALVNKIWNKKVKRNAHFTTIFDGVTSLLKELKQNGFELGIITSKNKSEYKNDFIPFQLTDYFDTVICVEDTVLPKPSPEPILKYLEITGASKENLLYIGDTIYDFQCANSVNVDFGLALWGCNSVKHIYATYFLKSPKDILHILNTSKNSLSEMPWLKWAMELQFISQAGSTYSENKFDRERFERLREIAVEMVSLKTNTPSEDIKNIFGKETGYQTPKLDTRAAIFQEGKILLVKENNGTWSLPGGWVDALESIKSNTIKEVKEEAGLDVIPTRLIALHDRNKHNYPIYFFGVCKALVLCEIIGGTFKSNKETVESAFWEMDQLPPLALEKNSEEEIKLCFDAYNAEIWNTIFD
jgi:HAD superfamily hydrolase (TIGR01549 family)